MRALQRFFGSWRFPALALPLLLLVQLALNASWSVAFFGMNSPGAGLVVIGVFLVAIAVTIRLFAAIDRPAAWLLAPYLAWVSFATFLNAAIWWING